MTLTHLRTRFHGYQRAIVFVQLIILIGYVSALFMWTGPSEASSVLNPGSLLLKREVLSKGRDNCVRRRKQINVFMAAFFGGPFAADQWYARNFQLGIPKLLIMCGYLPSVLGVFAPAGFASMLWLADVILWGIGLWTTETRFGNPTKGCAVIGW